MSAERLREAASEMREAADEMADPMVPEDAEFLAAVADWLDVTADENESAGPLEFLNWVDPIKVANAYLGDPS